MWVKLCIVLGKQLPASQNIRCRLSYIKKKQKYFYKESHTSVCKSITHNMPKVETAQKPSGRCGSVDYL